MKKILISLTLAAIFAATGCTDNVRAKSYGGTMTIKLPSNTELVDATWKNADLWYLTRPRKSGESIDTLTFTEDSNFGVLEGKIIFVER